MSDFNQDRKDPNNYLDNTNNGESSSFTPAQTTFVDSVEPIRTDVQYAELDDASKKTKSRHIVSAIVAILVTVIIFLGIILPLKFLLINPNDKSAVSESVDSVQPQYEDYASIFEGFFDFKDTPEVRAKLDKLYTAYHSLKEDYYTDLSDEELIDAMLQGLLNNRDQYTRYISAEDNARSKEDMSGEYSGIGCTIQQGKDKQFIVADLTDDSPALLAGIKVNDIFLAVDGVETTTMVDTSDLANKVRGEEGTEVKLRVYRPSESKEYEFTVKRAKITNSDIRSKMLTEDVGYIRMTTFDTGLSDNFKAAMEKLQKEGAKNMIFDLRGNTGGYVSEVTDMLDYLLPEGTIITLKGRRGGEEFTEEITSKAEMGVPEDMKYVILTNQYTASASELFSGCLRDYDKAILVGEKTYGKGVGTISFDFEDGSGANITNFYYYLPKGSNVDGVGLEPDFEVHLSEDQQDKTVGQMSPEDDEQLKVALEKIKTFK